MQSRYYNPEWGRFVNADAIAGVTGELLSHNMFAYCFNNPIRYIDSNGFYPIDTSGAIPLLPSYDDIAGELGGTLPSAIKKINNNIPQLDMKHLKAAVGDLNGEPILKSNGQPYEHLTEVKDAMRGVKNGISTIEKHLNNPYINYTPMTRGYLRNIANIGKKFLNRANKVLTSRELVKTPSSFGRYKIIRGGDMGIGGLSFGINKFNLR